MFCLSLGVMVCLSIPPHLSQYSSVPSGISEAFIFVSLTGIKSVLFWFFPVSEHLLRGPSEEESTSSRSLSSTLLFSPESPRLSLQRVSILRVESAGLCPPPHVSSQSYLAPLGPEFFLEHSSACQLCLLSVGLSWSRS